MKWILIYYFAINSSGGVGGGVGTATATFDEYVACRDAVQEITEMARFEERINSARAICMPTKPVKK